MVNQEQGMLDAAILSVQPYLADLDLVERRALNDFALIWTIFESHVSERVGLSEGKSVNPKVLCNFAGRADVRCTAVAQLNKAIDFWKDRYVDAAGKTNSKFDDLKFRNNDKKESVAAILKVGHGDIDERQAALIIVYRLRCNLFHGAKWEYGMKGQRQNFRHGTNVMLESLGAEPEILPV